MYLQNQIIWWLSGGTSKLHEVTHHLWYLQVSAPLTSSVTAPASLMSSIITTRGSSPPLSLSIWFARSERYNCNSCKRKKGIQFLLRSRNKQRPSNSDVTKSCLLSSQSRITPLMPPDRRSDNPLCAKGLTFCDWWCMLKVTAAPRPRTHGSWSTTAESVLLRSSR